MVLLTAGADGSARISTASGRRVVGGAEYWFRSTEVCGRVAVAAVFTVLSLPIYPACEAPTITRIVLRLDSKQSRAVHLECAAQSRRPQLQLAEVVREGHGNAPSQYVLVLIPDRARRAEPRDQ